MKNSAPSKASAGDESLITEITIQPDGRLYVFGTSRQVLEVLERLRPGDERLGLLMTHVRRAEAASPPR